MRNRYAMHVVHAHLEDFEPQRLDDNPGCCDAGPHEPLAEKYPADKLPALWIQLREFNRQALLDAAGGQLDRWAILVASDEEEGINLGHTRRVITPFIFRSATIRWPRDWQPETLLDVPHRAFVDQSGGGSAYDFAGVLDEVLGHNRYEVSARAENIKSKYGHSGWEVALAVEWEDLSSDVVFADGIEVRNTVSRYHVIRAGDGWPIPAAVNLALDSGPRGSAEEEAALDAFEELPNVEPVEGGAT